MSPMGACGACVFLLAHGEADRGADQILDQSERRRDAKRTILLAERAAWHARSGARRARRPAWFGTGPGVGT